MSVSLAQCADSLEQLRDHLEALNEKLEELELPRPDQDEWFQLLIHKLLPQLDPDTPLIIAVVGGTNTGKSVVFNHVAGETVSATSPLASGTRHPMCLVPAGFDTARLETMFDGFTLVPWSRPEQTLEDTQDHLLFWRTCASLPANLLVLDSPDIDSDAEVNWERAERLRRSADVLVAVLTQQKYNDAAVKQFFRRAAGEDLATVIVFNQCQLPDDETYWPIWLETFTSETGTTPELVYLAPNDRSAAESGELVFTDRQHHATGQARDLQQDLSSLRFESIKFRSLRGSLGQLVSEQTRVPAWLDSVQARSDEFRLAAELLSTQNLVTNDAWRTIPAGPLIDAVRDWWDGHRSGWTAGIHTIYNAIGRGLAWPIRRIIESRQPVTDDALGGFRQDEWETIVATVEQVYQRLAFCRDAGGELMSARITPLLDGQHRQQVLEQLATRHAGCDLHDELNQTVGLALEEFRAESPRSFRMLKRIDKAAAAARPVTSVALFCVGFGPVADAVAPAAMHTALHVAGDVAGGTVVATLGESAVSQPIAQGVGRLQVWLHSLQQKFAVHRASWLASQLEELVLGDLITDLENAAETPTSDAFLGVESTVTSLAAMLDQLAPSPSHTKTTETP
ncbi:MAG: GTPase domain-containing protein [Planctomycetota bacterium]|nr:GTPase domain-containing protein [Planctomycetota bacterium]